MCSEFIISGVSRHPALNGDHVPTRRLVAPLSLLPPLHVAVPVPVHAGGARSLVVLAEAVTLILTVLSAPYVLVLLLLQLRPLFVLGSRPEHAAPLCVEQGSSPSGHLLAKLLVLLLQGMSLIHI